MKGNEHIHIGIRPYEMHAGNTLAIVAYPILLCQLINKRGIVPKFTFILSLNDWEQDALIGEDIYKYHFDVHAKNTTLQFCVEDNNRSTVETWSKVIKEAVKEIKKRFPKTKIVPVFNSELKTNPVMKYVVIKTLTQRSALKETMLQSSGKPTNGSPLPFAAALCPKCKYAQTSTKVCEDELITTECSRCKYCITDSYESFEYWLHHKPLFAARWKIFQFTHSISGGDHFKEGDVKTRKALYEFFFEESAPSLNMLFSPIFIAQDGQKMSKSRNNYYSLAVDDILAQARICDEPVLHIPN